MSLACIGSGCRDNHHAPEEPDTLSYVSRCQWQHVQGRTPKATCRVAGLLPHKPRQAFSALIKSIAEETKLHHSPLFLDLPPFRYIADKYQPQQVLELGCGLGGYMRMFQEWGAADVLGVDGSLPGDLFLSKGNFLHHDLRQPLNLHRTYALVVCLEMIGQIDAQYKEIVLETIHHHAKDRIIFSAAEPGQSGKGYINCKPLSHWLAAWRRLGWMPDAFDGLAVRSLATFSWLRRNLIVLVRSDHAREVPSPFSTADLERLARHPFRWTDHNPNIYTYPLSEPLPALLEQAPHLPTS